jgi:hypothetical protein
MDQMVKKGFENQKFNQGFSKSAEQILGKPGKKPPTSSGGAGGGSGAGGGAGGGSGGNTRPPAPKPAAPKPAAPKPAPTGLTGNKALAVAAAEKARIRGTSETDNPLMKNMRSRMSAPTSAQSPDVAKLGKGNQSLVNNPNAPKVAPSNTLNNTVAAALKPAAFNSTSTPTPAAAPKPPTRQLSAADKRQGIKASYEYDAYDLVLEYLLSQGHADTLEEANYVMLELDAEMIGDIVEVMAPPPPVKAPPKTTEGKKVPQITGDGKGKPMGGPYND